MLLVAATTRGPADLRRLVWLQVVGLTLFSLVTLARAHVGEGGRLRTTEYYDVNDLATLIVCTVPLVLYLWRRPTGPWGRTLVAGATLVLILTLGKTGSRGGFLGLVAVAGYLLLRFSAMSRVKRASAVAVLVILFGALANEAYFERIETVLHPKSDYNWSGHSETGRMEVWKRGMGYMLSHPVLGVGARAFGVAEGSLAPEARERGRYGHSFAWTTAHNSFIQVGAELGVPGLLLFVALLVGAWRMLVSVRRRAAGERAVLAQVLTASLLGFVVTAFFLSQAYTAYLYLLIGLGVGLARITPMVRVRAPRGGTWFGGPFPAPARDPAIGGLPVSGGLTNNGR
ncbi:MAG: hypothetical protein AUI15_25805 [Actinobacteria bacterium 13_2_20CM_2_66_6]|nr:MAG: hypothetical protein AUI15_25805 [Actinobacteria bacterium 13_2_20CM_2_66_6]